MYIPAYKLFSTMNTNSSLKHHTLMPSTPSGPYIVGFLNEVFQGPSEKGEGDCRVLVMVGGVDGWIDSRSYMLGYGERFLGPYIGWTESCK